MVFEGLNKSINYIRPIKQKTDLALQVKLHLLATLDNAIPNDNLINVVLLGRILSHDVDEELFVVPVEQLAQIRLEIEVEVSQVFLDDY